MRKTTPISKVKSEALHVFIFVLKDLPPEILRMIWLHMPTTDQIRWANNSEQFSSLLEDREPWRRILVKCKVLSSQVSFLIHMNSAHVRVFTCNSENLQSHDDYPLELLLACCDNIVNLDLEGCLLLTSMQFTQCTWYIKFLNISGCTNVPALQIVRGVRYLLFLREFRCNRVWRLTGYNIYQAIEYCADLKILECMGAGIMRPWIVKLILRALGGVEVFNCHTYAFHDLHVDRVDWYKITHGLFPHVKFSELLLSQVEEYIRTDAILAQYHALEMSTTRKCFHTPPI